MHLIDRHLSWLSFNHRVLQEAADSRLPLLERLHFLAIFSSNLDEFFAVKVASIDALRHAEKKPGKTPKFDPTALLEAIRTEVERQQKEFGKHYLDEILPALRARGIGFSNENELNTAQHAAAREYWELNVRRHVQPVFIEPHGPAPFLHNRQIYLVVALQKGEGEGTRYAVVEIPTQHQPRFIEMPQRDGHRWYVFLDDIIRIGLPDLFPGWRVAGAYSVKLSRDAELHIEDEFSGDLLEKIREGLSRRRTGAPSRFLYDPEMPQACVDLLRTLLGLYPEGMIPGWRYHNFSDFFAFAIAGAGGLENEQMTALRDHALDASLSLFDAIEKRDRILHYPYHSYDYVIRFLEEAAHDPDVTSIEMTLYRVAPNSQAIRALVDGAHNGKAITAFVEMKARFDEEANFFWAEELEHAGARVIYSLPGLKVHSKLCLVSKYSNGAEKLYAYLCSGNFNEKTARVYTDHGLFTADTRITTEVRRIFDFLGAGREPVGFDNLLVAPFNMRERFVAMVDEEIRNARAGKRAYIILKLNALEDPLMIAKLCEAADAGVTIKMIVRGICCLPVRDGAWVENIDAISIVDRFLEHGRVYIFHSGGNERYFVGSADWMTRNLSRRVEVVFPIFDDEVRSEIRAIIDTQLRDNMKARILDSQLRNRFRELDGPVIRSQMEIYNLLKQRASAESKKITDRALRH